MTFPSLGRSPRWHGGPNITEPDVRGFGSVLPWITNSGNFKVQKSKGAIQGVNGCSSVDARRQKTDFWLWSFFPQRGQDTPVRGRANISGWDRVTKSSVQVLNKGSWPVWSGFVVNVCRVCVCHIIQPSQRVSIGAPILLKNPNVCPAGQCAVWKCLPSSQWCNTSNKSGYTFPGSFVYFQRPDLVLHIEASLSQSWADNAGIFLQ